MSHPTCFTPQNIATYLLKIQMEFSKIHLVVISLLMMVLTLIPVKVSFVDLINTVLMVAVFVMTGITENEDGDCVLWDVDSVYLLTNNKPGHYYDGLFLITENKDRILADSFEPSPFCKDPNDLDLPAPQPPYPVDPCDFITCGTNEICVDGTCECAPGYTDYGNGCVPTDPCFGVTCGTNEECRWSVCMSTRLRTRLFR